MSSSFAQQEYLSSSSLDPTDEPLKRDDYDSEKAAMTVQQPQNLGSRTLHPAFDIMRWTCAAAHIGLIVFLIVLAAKRPDEGYQKFSGTVFFSQPSFLISGNDIEAAVGQTLQTGVKVGFGWIVTGWTIVLTLTTQKLALRRQLSLYTSLTAKHDANEAWMGFGSAAMASIKWRELGFRASLNSIFLPLAYLAGIASLHSVATGMFGLSPKPVNTTFPFSSQGIPDFTGAAVGNALTGADALMTMLSLNTLIFPGLAPGADVGVIYDIPDPTSNVSTQVPLGTILQVNATYFDVSCGSLSGSVQNVDGAPEFVFGTELGLGNTTVTDFPNTISQHSLVVRPAPWGPILDDDSDPKTTWPSSILIFTTVPVSDSSNNVVQPVQVNPPMTYVPSGSTTKSSTSQLTALACNLTVDISSNKAFIDPQTNFLWNISGQVTKVSTQSSPFPVTYRSTPLDLDDSPGDALQAIWSILPIASVSPLESQLLGTCTESNSDEVCGTLFQPEQFVMESLNIFPDLLLEQTSAPSINLTDLENVLSRMTAIEFWAEGQGNNLKFANTLSTEGVAGASTSKAFVTNQNTVQVQNFYLVFAINRLQLFGALAITIVLLLLATPALLDNNNLKIDSIGILQMIWLANDHPEVQKSVTMLSDPSVDDLRKAGLLVKRNFQSHNTEGLPQQPC